MRQLRAHDARARTVTGDALAAEHVGLRHAKAQIVPDLARFPGSYYDPVNGRSCRPRVCKSALCTTLPDGIVYKPVLSP